MSARSVAAVALVLAGCGICAKGRQEDREAGVGHQPSSASSSSAAASSADRSDTTPRVRGMLGARPFAARTAVADVYPKWVTITVYDRDLTCAGTALRAGDMAVQFTVPSGPDGDFFVSREVGVPLQVSGAGGVSTIPTGSVSVRIDEVRIGRGSVVRGSLEAQFATAADEAAPRYALAGPFEAMVCSAQPTVASMPKLDRSQGPVQGRVGGKMVTFASVLAYLRDDGWGKPTLLLKAYTRSVDCHSVERATPFLTGVEVGAGPRGDYHAGSLMPAAWVLQMSDGHSGERSVHADDGAGIIQIDSVETRVGGEVRGSLAAMTIEETDPALAFTLSGTFVGKVCGREQRAW